MLSSIEVVELALGEEGLGSVCVTNISWARNAYISLPNPESISLSSDSYMCKFERHRSRITRALTMGRCSFSKSCGTAAEAEGGDAALCGDLAGGDGAPADVGNTSAMTATV